MGFIILLLLLWYILKFSIIKGFQKKKRKDALLVTSALQVHGFVGTELKLDF